MYSALRASLWLFKFGPVEFSPFHFVRATTVGAASAANKSCAYMQFAAEAAPTGILKV